jgi:trimeric autotransporter adhesin
MKKSILTITLFLGVTTITFSQSLAINNDGSLPNSNAILDVKSTTKGILFPRMTSAQRAAIPATTGLMVYDTETKSFWYNTGAEWKTISASALAATGPWLLTGNSGTDSNNFLGTTDNAPLNIRVNNIASGRIDHINSNAFWGYGSGAVNTTGLYNTGVGHEALTSNTTGYSNTAYGRFALRTNNTGHSNTAVGMDALTVNSTGARNTAVGMLSLLSNTTGNENTATGFDALRSNTTGGGNTATGANALNKNIAGTDNTAYGARAMHNNTTGYGNTANGYNAMPGNNGNLNIAIGYYCMWLAAGGSNNIAIGSFALTTNQAGSFNTAIGDHALYGNQGSYNTGIGENTSVLSGDDVTNATAIGAGATVDASNKVRIGNSAVTVIEGQVPFTTPSDGRYKFNVEENVKGLDFILQLRPVTYQFDVKRFDENLGTSTPISYDDAMQMRRSGFIAQEVENAAVQSGYNFSGIIKPKSDKEHYSLSYDAFVVPLVKAVQEQQTKIDAQQQEINDQKQLLSNQQQTITGLQQQLDEIRKIVKAKPKGKKGTQFSNNFP